MKHENKECRIGGNAVNAKDVCPCPLPGTGHLPAFHYVPVPHSSFQVFISNSSFFILH